MDFLRRNKHGGEPVRFDFTVHVKELAPWPSGKKSLAIGWQRGAKRKGSTRCQEPAAKSGTLSSSYQFNETFQVPATLYRETPPGSTAPGKFRKKCLVLVVLETDGRAKATSILGRIVINLAEYAGYDVEEFLHFPVTCNRAIAAAVGQPLLRVDLVCRWRKKQPSQHREGSISGTSSISTDTSASTLSSHLSSFKPARASSMISATSAGASPKDRVSRQLADLEGFEEPGEEATAGPSTNAAAARGHRAAGLPPLHQVPASEAVAVGVAAVVTGEGGGGEAAASSAATWQESKHRASALSASSVPNTLESIAEGDGDGSSPGAGPNGPPSERPSRQKSKLDKVSRWLSESANAEATGGGDTAVDASGVETPRTPESPFAVGNPFAPSPRGASPLAAQTNPFEGTVAPDADICCNPFDDTPPAEGDSATNPFAEAAVPQAGRATGHRRSESTPDAGGGGPGSGAGGARRRASSGASSAQAGRIRSQGDRLAKDSRSPEGVSLGGDGAEAAVLAVGMSGVQLAGPVAAALGLEAAVAEATVRLQMLAAIESAIYFARRQGNTALRRQIKRSHAPARRLARTIKALGPVTGRAFGRHAVQAMRGVVASSGEDVGGLVFWWSNCVGLRLLISSDRLAAGSDLQAQDWEHTETDLCVTIAVLERHLYERSLQSVWWRILVPAVASSDAHARSAGHQHHHPPGPLASGAEDGDAFAINRWLDALEAIRAALCPVGLLQVGGHARLLASQVLSVCLRRMDVMLFAALVSRGLDEPLPEVFSGVGGGALSEVTYLFPNLDEGVLPFSQTLTFSTGMRVKLAVSKWEAWSSDASVSCDHGPVTDLFPLLRGVANLLMLPKEMLLEEEVRAEVCPMLDLDQILELVTRYAPDEYAPEPITQQLLRSLEAQAAQGRKARESAGRREGRPSMYDSPARTSSMRGKHLREVVQGGLPAVDREAAAESWGRSGSKDLAGLELDAESEDELQELAAEVCQPALGAPPTRRWQRFALLKQLWRAA